MNFTVLTPEQEERLRKLEQFLIEMKYLVRRDEDDREALCAGDVADALESCGLKD